MSTQNGQGPPWRRRRSSTTKWTIAAMEKRVQAVELRRLGLGYRQIAEKMALSSPGNAYRMVAAELKDLRAECKESAEQLRAVEAERLDMMWRALMPRIASGDAKAVSAGVQIMKRRADMFGLDSPQQVEHTVMKMYAVKDASPDCPAWPSAPVAAAASEESKSGD